MSLPCTVNGFQCVDRSQDFTKEIGCVYSISLIFINNPSFKDPPFFTGVF